MLPNLGEEIPDVLIFDSRPGVLLLNGQLGAPASVSPRSCGSFWPTSEGLGGCSGSPARLVVAFDPEFVLGCACILALRSDAWEVLEKTQLLGVPGRLGRGCHGEVLLLGLRHPRCCSRHIDLFVSEAKIQGHLVAAGIFKREASADDSEYQYHLHAKGLILLILQGSDWDNISMPCSSFPWTNATTFGDLGIGIVAYSPLGRGFLSSGPKLVDTLTDNDFRKYLPRFQPENMEKNAAIFEHVSEMAARKGCTPSQLALAWVHHQGNDVCPIPGTTKIEKFNQNVRALSVKLTPKEIADLESYAAMDVVHGDRYLDIHPNTWKDSETPPLSSWKAT
ncbi:hypothetical protein ACQ4PT_022763 [Festuca glaucescens]